MEGHIFYFAYFSSYVIFYIIFL